MRRFFIVALLTMLPGRALAGPPFLTDDPVPVEYRHYEAYTFLTIDKNAGVSTTTNAPALEFNYGPLRNVQLSITVPYTFVSTPEDAELSEPGSIEGATVSGLGDVEIGVKYRFLQENRAMPQISFYPSAELPTGSFDKGIGSGRTGYRFPLWIQKSWGQWTTYGGGGYAINSAPGELNYTFAGWLVERAIGRSSTVGAEIYYEGPQFTGDKWATFYNVGGEVAVSDHVSILMSAGHTVSGDDESTLYFGLGFQGGPGDP